ncbi:peroxisome assembly protein 12-like [Limulus polyphemus]|uniref:Peroxisome assembly protein 12 n=1 Tax=Limulus polyphemus TaxID=6850 RepID=A0ABM1C5S4_LIMPO|nr:peroxisome assembly protein 12-like [Limulus polyphemus]
MAEFGAHITTFVGEKPSIFELLAQDSFARGLRTAAKYFIRVLAENNPAKYGFYLHHFEELYLISDLFVQYLHLKTYGASFAEHFYGLQRVPKKPDVSAQIQKQKASSLSKKQIRMSLFCLAIAPYVKTKLDKLFETLHEKWISARSQKQDVREKMEFLYLYVYPFFHFIFECLLFHHVIMYAIGRSSYHSPLVQLSGTELWTLTNENRNVKSWEEIPRHIVWITSAGLAKALSLGLSVGAFFFQFLEWWYNQDNTPPGLAALPTPPPPRKLQIEISNDLCPLCQKKRTNDTALSTSGFVFCYPCIYGYLTLSSRCPVTGYPSSVNQLVKLYPPGDII